VLVPVSLAAAYPNTHATLLQIDEKPLPQDTDTVALPKPDWYWGFTEYPA